MPELAIPVGEYIGPGYVDWDQFEYVPGFTVDDIKMRLQYAQYDGVVVDGILLQFGICYGGSTRHAMDIHNYLRSLGIPVRAHVMSVTASSGTIVALAADEIELEHTAQWMVHRPLFSEGSQSQRSEDIRADADRLDREEQGMVDLYVACTGKTEAEVRALIAVDRFMSATEALAFGFATKVNPLKGKAPATAQVQARLKTVRLAVARADKHAVRLRAASPKPKASTKPARPAATPRPMAKTPAKPATKPAAQNRSSLTAAQKSAAQAVAALAKSLGVKATIEGIEADTEVEAVATPTVLANGDGTLYTDGELAQGSEVFNDEALTEPTADGVYGTEDGRDITVAAGVVESIAQTAAATGEEAPAADTAAITAAITAALAPITADLADLKAKINSTVPPTPRPRAAAAQVPDGKAKPKAKAPHHSTM
jgi:hypothetical protein